MAAFSAKVGLKGMTGILGLEETKKKVIEEPKNKAKKVRGEARQNMADAQDKAKLEKENIKKRAKADRLSRRVDIARNKTAISRPTRLGAQAEAIRRTLTGQ